MTKTKFPNVRSFDQRNHNDAAFNIHELYIENFGVGFDVLYQYNANDNEMVPEFLKTFNEKIMKGIDHKVKKSIIHGRRNATTYNVGIGFDLDYSGECERFTNEYFYIFKDFIIFISTNEVKNITLNFYYHNETEQFKEIFKKVEESFPVKSKKNKREFNIICSDKRGYHLKTIKLGQSDDENFFDNYNDDLQEVSTEILSRLNDDNKGIVLLHGAAGTGKTTYLRYLIRNLSEKKVIYLPPDLSDALSKPDFVTFLMDHKNAVLIIEDAENVIKEREAGGIQAVSNILNISDGILGDALRFQVVATFNTDIKYIDKALRRPGRLIAEYEFKTLSVDKTNKLLKKEYGEDVELNNKELTLAEIYNYTKKKFKAKDTKIPLGFT
jgi:ATPase family associated with various cellular activities (AAA)